MISDADIRKAIPLGKLVVRSGNGHVFYGREWMEASKGQARPIPDEVVVILADDQWDEFARRFGLPA